MKIITPKFTPRPYQTELIRKFLTEDIKRLLLVWHRRAGKDTLAFQLMWMKAIQVPGLYLYMAPVISQAASIIWRGRGKDGVGFLEYIPKELIAKINESTMSIYLVNGSIIRVTGSNAWESLIGSNPLGLVFSEFQNSDLRAWELLRPILAENGGSACFTATPRGYNHLYDLVETNRDNPSWVISTLTVDDTRLNNGLPVISNEAIEEERRAGMAESVIQQEFYCSFSAAVSGGYYSDEMALIKDGGRVCDFDIDANLPVYVSFDLGISDCTSVCLVQVHPGGDVKVIYHFEDSGKAIGFYALELKKIQQRLGFKRFGKFFLPHDIRVTELGSGLTRIEQLRRAGIVPRIVGNHKIVERIQCVRVMLNKTWFHQSNCKILVKSLSEYRARWDEVRKVSLGPLHDNTSHAADSFGYFAVGFLQNYERANFDKQVKYASFMP